MNKKQDKYITNNIGIIGWIVGLLIVCTVGVLLSLIISFIPTGLAIIFGIAGIVLFICLVLVMNEYESLGDNDEDI